MLRLVDRVTSIEPAGGRFGLGRIRAEFDVDPQAWFLTCHFVDDRVMPGTLMYECCLHTLRILLMRMGWVGEEGQVVCEPVAGVASRLKCRGQVVVTTKTVTYEVTLKEIGYRPEPYAICDALMYADGKPVVEIGDMSLRMSGLTREKLDALWRDLTPRPPLPRGEGEHAASTSLPAGKTPGTRLLPPLLAGVGGRGGEVLFDRDRITAFAVGNPSDAFGDRYRVFDAERVIARLPGPPYQFLDRITRIENCSRGS